MGVSGSDGDLQLAPVFHHWSPAAVVLLKRLAGKRQRY